MTDLPENLRRLEQALRACRDDPEILKILQFEGIGPYAPVKVLCKGSGGVAYLAEQIEPVQRRVAIFVSWTHPGDRKSRADFQTGETEHAPRAPPLPVQVLETGIFEDGRAYRVMHYEAGLPASAYCL